MKTRYTLFLLITLIGSSNCPAGSSWHYKCTTAKCGFEGDLGIGGGFVAHKVTGYCSRCDKFVSIGWKNETASAGIKKIQDKSPGLRDSPPERVGRVWNAATGLYGDLYACPECRQPFMDIDDFSLGQSAGFDRKFCPKCKKLSLKFDKRALTD